jgi:hypothetical protein
MSKVTVIADKEGHVTCISENNPEYGYIRVEQIVQQIDNKGWLKNARRIAFINGKVEDLVKLNYQEGDQLPGKIIVKESLEPFYLQNPDKHLKVAGESGIVCRLDDQPIYRDVVYTNNIHAEDSLIFHNNSEEIRDVNSAIREIKSLRKRKKKTAENDD